ncbi:MAG: hypothetical protein V8R75_03735 [Oscillospiraceae bacterium]
MRDGSFIPTRSHRRLQAVMLVVVLMALAAWLLASALDSGRTLAFALAGLLHVMILVALVNLLTQLKAEEGICPDQPHCHTGLCRGAL